jgi:phosphinothricin tripeptide acetyl hydrolase
VSASDVELIRELIALQPASGQETLAEHRARYDRAEASFAADAPRPGPIVDAGGCAAEWTLPPRDGTPVVLYVHGGGYLAGSPRSHRHLAAAIGKAASASVLTIDYRLAPEHRFPAAVHDTVAACRWLLTRGVEVVLVGDSAGGGLVVAALLALRGDGHRPVAGVCLSPWVDLTCGSGSHTQRAAWDPVLSTSELRAMAAEYLGAVDPQHPLASPVYAHLADLPPLLVMVGSDEILLDDARTLVARARHVGVDAILDEWPGMIHVWPWWFPVLDDGRRAIQTIGAFVVARTRGARS